MNLLWLMNDISAQDVMTLNRTCSCGTITLKELMRQFYRHIQAFGIIRSIYCKFWNDRVLKWRFKSYIAFLLLFIFLRLRHVSSYYKLCKLLFATLICAVESSCGERSQLQREQFFYESELKNLASFETVFKFLFYRLRF